MNSPAACNVHHTQLGEKSDLVPQPSRGNAVDDGVDQRKQTVRVEVAPGVNGQEEAQCTLYNPHHPPPHVI